METRDGFIMSIFNYCDRWCEACALTSHCRVFADVTRAEASQDPNMAAVVQAPSPVHHFPPGAPRWLEDVFEQMNALAGLPLTHEELMAWDPRMAPEHDEIYERAKAYCQWVYECLGRRDNGGGRGVTDPIAVITWFSSLIASKIRRALTGLAEFDGTRDVPPDHEGAAKVALLGIDRSFAAWQQLVAEQRVGAAEARPCLEELAWIRAQLEAAIPDARAFVRPGFDEPDAVSNLCKRTWDA